jgi:hypothetical protein
LDSVAAVCQTRLATKILVKVRGKMFSGMSERKILVSTKKGFLSMVFRYKSYTGEPYDHRCAFFGGEPGKFSSSSWLIVDPPSLQG